MDCDLHTHSVFSDGSLTPAELVRLAEEKGLAALALTDHNTARGLPALTAAGKDSPVITVPGCEFSTDYGETELHIVGLFFPEHTWDAIERYVEPLHKNKEESNRRMIRKLRDAGCDITYEEADATTSGRGFNRAHVALLLVEKGYAADMKDAFRRWLNKSSGFYTETKRPDAFETISFIRSCGAVAVLAHPFLNLTAPELEVFLPRAKNCGLQAMETNYPKFTPADTSLAAALCKKYGLLQSGGSDFHGEAKPEIALGTGAGALHVPFAFYEALAAAGK